MKDSYARLTMNVEEKHIQFLLRFTEEIISSLDDSAAAWATVGSTDLKVARLTVEMKIDFLLAVESGQLTAKPEGVARA